LRTAGIGSSAAIVRVIQMGTIASRQEDVTAGTSPSP
jgi:hypothetical protein